MIQTWIGASNIGRSENPFGGIFAIGLCLRRSKISCFLFTFSFQLLLLLKQVFPTSLFQKHISSHQPREREEKVLIWPRVRYPTATDRPWFPFSCRVRTQYPRDRACLIFLNSGFIFGPTLDHNSRHNCVRNRSMHVNAHASNSSRPSYIGVMVESCVCRLFFFFGHDQRG